MESNNVCKIFLTMLALEEVPDNNLLPTVVPRPNVVAKCKKKAAIGFR